MGAEIGGLRAARVPRAERSHQAVCYEGEQFRVRWPALKLRERLCRMARASALTTCRSFSVENQLGRGHALNTGRIQSRNPFQACADKCIAWLGFCPQRQRALAALTRDRTDSRSNGRHETGRARRPTCVGVRSRQNEEDVISHTALHCTGNCG